MEMERIYGNLNLYNLTDDELFELGVTCVKVITLGVHLIEYTSGEKNGVARDFDLDKYELSDLMVRSNRLLTKYDESDRMKYISLLDDTLFIFVVYEDSDKSVKGYIKQNINKELKSWVRKTVKRTM